jgi:hypothetical protein
MIRAIALMTDDAEGSNVFAEDADDHCLRARRFADRQAETIW